MAVLPVIKQPTYDLYMHSLKKNVEYRPFNVGEEKILMMVSQSKDSEFVVKNIRKVIDSCILDPDVNTSKLATYDVENLLLKIRAKSSGEIVDIKYKDEDDGKTYDIQIDLDALDVTFPEDHEYIIKINDDVALRMRDITFDKILEHQKAESTSSEEKKASIMFDLILDCVESIIDGDNVINVDSDVSREELVQFLEQLTGISNKLYKFIETMPSLQFVYKTPEGKEIIIRDIRNFLQ